MNHQSDYSVDSYPSVLQNLIDKSGSLTALLVHKDGICFAEAGDTSYVNVTALAALVAGMFSATREVARMVGEKQFSILLQQGDKRHIHISLIGDSAMMVIIFEDYQRIGLVRHEARRTAEHLARLVTRSENPAEESKKVAVPEFKEYALDLIDRIFETK
jgi:predicted regulator of Ras-like GTPase activity (Roadblock/LC7/MglB family)